MQRVVVAGIGTDVGKTIASAVLTKQLGGDYWKPVQSGGSDSEVVRRLIGKGNHQVHAPSVDLLAPLSPHHAARLEGVEIEKDMLIPPETKRPLIIEMVGGISVPLSQHLLTLDVFPSFGGKWVLVSKHYLGSINHTLLTLEVLQTRGIPLHGILFNGEPNPDTEEVILSRAKAPLIGRLLPEKKFSNETTKRYAKLWNPL